MANNPILYRVLWVDEESDPLGFIPLARKYDLLVTRVGSWQEAKEMLLQQFEDFSAVILDGNCVLNKGEEPTPDFLYQAVREMENIFAQHEENLPWYVLSSGTAEDFSRTIQRITMGERSEMESSWGRVFFRKDDRLESLCETVRKSVAHRIEYKVMRMYRPVFDTLKNYFDAQSTNTMLDILLALHYPETHRNFDPVLYYTQLRRILEYLFRAANQQGILPDAVLGEQGKVNLTNSSMYLCGREITLNRNRTYRYGKPGSSFFSPIMAQLVKSILVVANKNSHSTELDTQEEAAMRDYNRTAQSNNLLFGYALHLCDVIVYFGQMIQQIQEHRESVQHRDRAVQTLVTPASEQPETALRNNRQAFSPKREKNENAESANGQQVPAEQKSKSRRHYWHPHPKGNNKHKQHRQENE